MKNILWVSLLTLFSCTQNVLHKSQYKIIDTLDVHKNGFYMVLSYDVIIKYDNNFYFGHIENSGKLTYLNFKRIDTNKFY